MAGRATAEIDGYTLTACAEQYYSEPGTAFAFQPPLDDAQLEQLSSHWIGADVEQRDEDTRIFITNNYAQRFFGDKVYIMSNLELGAQLLQLTQQEGHIDGK